ncbi:antirestriction protein [Citrobacter freundii]|uniref:antirestriction protein n=1 Tax=Citrobacter TaxID=544 RepID=UPI0012AAB6C1|nr:MULTISPECIES: antirestriction protein [Citrobacter]HCP9940547.1 antirestriction protein [Escherichia coli]EKW5624612.1 antirestriction protein [Citrobacter freundii]MBJ9086009.1 antirestriction protein [Citrobacter freundii]MCT4736179.1 antirestriction protein [Citrobacter freundii]MDN4198259.1 antirestriction protein [Citrobacter freundii]
MNDSPEVLIKEETTEIGRLIFHTLLFRNYCQYANSASLIFMQRFCDKYEAGNWNYFKVGRNSGFMCPDTDEFYHFNMPNYFSGNVSAEAAGIIVTIFVLQACFNDAWEREDSDLCDHYREAMDTLKDYAATTDESRSIFRAID